MVTLLVASHDQKQDLEWQKQVLELFCSQHDWQFQVIVNLSSGLNYNKRGLKKLIKLITANQIERLVLTHASSLRREGYPPTGLAHKDKWRIVWQ